MTAKSQGHWRPDPEPSVLGPGHLSSCVQRTRTRKRNQPKGKLVGCVLTRASQVALEHTYHCGRCRRLDPGVGGGPGNPFQYSCLENPMDRGDSPVTVHRATKHWMWLKWLSMHIHVFPKTLHSGQQASFNYRADRIMVLRTLVRLLTGMCLLKKRKWRITLVTKMEGI